MENIRENLHVPGSVVGLAEKEIPAELCIVINLIIRMFAV